MIGKNIKRRLFHAHENYMKVKFQHLQIMLLEYSYAYSCVCCSLISFKLKQQNYIVGADPEPPKPKMFTTRHLMEKVYLSTSVLESL